MTVTKYPQIFQQEGNNRRQIIWWELLEEKALWELVPCGQNSGGTGPPQSGRPLSPPVKVSTSVHLQSVSSALNVASFNGPRYKYGVSTSTVYSDSS